ncbi:MAG: TolC family protein [Bacteroidota bacterium]
MKKIRLLFFILLLHLIAFTQERSLDFYIRAGIENSPFLKDLKNQQRANTIDSMRILAGYLPQVNAVSTNSYAPTVGGWGYDGAITNGSNFSQLVSVSKQLVSKENLKNQHEAIQLLNESLKTSGKISEQDLRKTITAQYISAFGNYQQYYFNKEVLQLFKKEQTILKSLTEKGVYRQTDYLSFLVTMQQQEIQITLYKNIFQNDFSSLNYLCGINDTSAVPLKKPEIFLSLLPEAENSIFYQQFLNDSLKLRNSDALIDYRYKPKVNVYGDGGYLTSFSGQAYKNFGVSLGLNLVVPIYDGKQKKMQHDKIEIAEQSRKQYRDYFKTQYSQQIAQLFQQLHAAEDLVHQSENQIKYVETLIEANQKLLETGDAHMADYIIAIGNYMNAKNTITLNRISQLQIINQINYWNRK